MPIKIVLVYDICLSILNDQKFQIEIDKLLINILCIDLFNSQRYMCVNDFGNLLMHMRNIINL